MEKYYSEPWEKVMQSLKTSEKGLNERDVRIRWGMYGYNELQKEKGITAIRIFLNQFKNALIILLLFAAIISLFLGEHIDSIAMFFIVLLSSVLGFIQEYKAEKALEALKKTSSPTARVIRGEKEFKIPAKELVPGDIIILEAGDIVPADSRVFQESSLQIDEASLTGESVPSKKIIGTFKLGTSIADQENMAFMGTIVTYGKGKAIITKTGMKTELGRVAKSIQTTKEVETPLQKKFAQMAKQIGAAVMALIAIVFIIGLARGEASFSHMLIFALSLTVAAVPNSLPVVVTIGLSMGAKKLAKENMLIKKLPAAESLGSVTIICSDKTGTLTKNQMTVKKIFTDEKILDVSGTGYDPIGEFYLDGKEVDPKKNELLLRIGTLCNNSKLVKNEKGFGIIGDPTEGALMVLGKKGGIDERYIKNNFSFIEELPFDSDRKMMTVLFKNRLNHKTEAYVKGAPDLLLKKCDRILVDGILKRLNKKEKEKILAINDSFAKDALRVLGIAYRDVKDVKNYNIKNVEGELTFIGLVGMIDPPRNEVKDSVEQCRQAGIEVMMITGDYSITAKAIAKQIGLFDRGDIVLTGEDIDHMSDEELEKRIENIRIIARALPIQKSRVVDALKKKGHIVAMTGDGVNDAPALKKADIGIAMGITGTDVAREVSKAILIDDNFATIVNAVSEGRNIYDKMIRSVRYLLSCNAGEITAVFIAILLHFPLPLIPLQILLMNLLTDDFPALGLGFEESDKDVMKRDPRDPKQKPISGRMFVIILVFGLIMGLGTLFMFSQYEGIDLNKARTVAFTTLVMFEMFAVISSRSLQTSFKKLNPFSNLWLLGAVCLSLLIQAAVIYIGPLQKIFGTVALESGDLLKILFISFLGFLLMEASKLVIRIESFKSGKARGVSQ